MIVVVLLSICVSLSQSSSLREVYSVNDCSPTTDGNNVPVRRCIGGNVAKVNYLNPFLVFDSLYDTKITNEANNALAHTSNTPTMLQFPAHPHRGFVEIRYVLSGVIEHKDSCGTNATTREGGAQLFNTGSGIVHEEMISYNNTLQLFQIWVNLPTPKKRTVKPYYITVSKNDIPITRINSNSLCTVKNFTHVFGSHATGLDMLDVSLVPPCEFHHRVNPKQNAFLYVYSGYVDVFPHDPVRVEKGFIAVLGEGDSLHILKSSFGKFIFLTAAMVPEKVFQHGGFVMGSEEAVRASISDLETGWKTN
eukprot:PhF_6_TR22389/c0_g1_i1/m.31766/K06911/K06911; uncharacterized protein